MRLRFAHRSHLYPHTITYWLVVTKYVKTPCSKSVFLAPQWVQNEKHWLVNVKRPQVKLYKMATQNLLSFINYNVKNLMLCDACHIYFYYNLVMRNVILGNQSTAIKNSKSCMTFRRPYHTKIILNAYFKCLMQHLTLLKST